ncbi:stalk domain-containing protein [Paenibacillus sp. FSL P2-0089]|uniref:stalk domain-containing protein n=1 Tax=Paenibacillus sp. FSL P2-0089 TaxID=2954526 RepID=UPI00315B1543
MRFKRIIALLLVFIMVIPGGIIHAADPVFKEDANLAKQLPSGLIFLEDTVDVTHESYEADIRVTFYYGEASYSPDSVQLSIVDDNPVGKRFEGNRLIIDQGAPAGTITIKAGLPDNFYTVHTITVVNSGAGNPQPSQPKISHTLLDTSDLNHLIISATALDDGVNKVQIRTFYKNASGMLPGDIVNLARESDNSSVFSVDITDQVSSMMRESNAYEMIYFFTMLDGAGGFLQYPENIDMNSLEGALTVKLAEAPDNGSGEPELDKASLIAKINEAKDLYAFSVAGNGFGEYPGEVMDALNTAIEAASHAKDTATTQAQIDAAYQDLAGSITSFKADAIKGASKADLMDKYDEAIILYWNTSSGESVGDYPKQARDVFFTGIVSVEGVLNNPAPPQDEIDDAYQRLYYAIQAYRAAQIKAGDPAPLQVKIDEAWELYLESKVGDEPGQYPEAVHSALVNAISMAQDTIFLTTTQKKIDEAYQALSKAMQELIDAKIPEPDKKELLQAKINEAQLLWDVADVGTSIGQYPAEAKDSLEAAIYAAKQGVNNAATEAELDAAYQALNTAITTFNNTKIKRGDTTALEGKIHDAWILTVTKEEGNDSGQYPSSAFNDLRSAITAAEQWVTDPINNPGTQAQINEAYEVLVNAIQTFLDSQNTGPNKQALQSAIAVAQSFLNNSVEGTEVGQYPSGSKAILQGAIDAAWDTLTNLSSTQTEVDQALANLTAALEDFKLLRIEPGESTFLQDKIHDAQDLLQNSVEGDHVGEYPSEAFDALEKAIADAETLIDSSGTQQQIDAAYQAIVQAIENFENAKIQEGDYMPLLTAVSEATALYNTSPEGHGAGQYWPEVKALFMTAIEAANVVLGGPSTQEEISQAMQVLANAVEEFQNSMVREGDSTKLQAAIAELTTLLSSVSEGDDAGEYPAGSKALLQAAVTAASNVISAPATQEEIDHAYEVLGDAADLFIAGIIPTGDNSKALGKIQEIGQLLEVSEAGNGVGQYPAEAMAALQAAFDAAVLVLDKPSSQVKLDAAYQALVDAADVFEKAQMQAGDSEEADAVLTEAGTLLKDSVVGEGVGQYPAEAVNALEAAIAAAKEVFEHPATQAQIDEAKETLEAAITTFKAAVNKEGDSEEAGAVVTEAGTLLKDSIVGEGVGEYPSEAVNALEAAIAAAKEVFDHPATQAQIDAAKAALEAAITTFKDAVHKGGDSEEAGAVLTEAGTLLKDSVVGEGVGEYPSEAVNALEAAIAAAKEVFEHPATQAQIDEAKETLEAAITTFKDAVNKEGDSEEADAVVTEAGTLLKDSVVGEGVGEYPSEAVNALEAAIAAAKEVFDHPATQAQIDATKAALETAVAAFQAAVIKAGDSGEVQTKINAAKTLLNESTEGSGVGQYPAGSKAILQAAITAAEEVIRTAATQAEINQANEKLTAAYNAFLASVIKKTDDSYTPPSTTPTTPTVAQPSTTQPVVQPSTKITDGLNTVQTGQGTVKAAASEVQAIMKAAKPVILESTLAVIDFGKNGLNVQELRQGLDASLELGALLTEKSTTDKVLAGTKLDQAGLQPLGGKVLDLIAQLNYSNGTSTRIKSFAEPVKVTVNLKELGLTGDTTNLTAIRFVPQADGTYKTIKLGGVYLPETNSFEFYTDSFSLYSIVKADSITKITFKIDSKAYSIGAIDKVNDVPPVIREQRSLVPVRAVAEALGAEVKWDHATKTATITLDGKVLTMTLGELIEGMDVPAQAIDGRIMVPLRYVSETLGAYVMWFPQDKRIEIIR